MTKNELPPLQEVVNKVNAGEDATALEYFLFKYESGGDRDFRRDLANALTEYGDARAAANQTMWVEELRRSRVTLDNRLPILLREQRGK